MRRLLGSHADVFALLPCSRLCHSQRCCSSNGVDEVRLKHFDVNYELGTRTIQLLSRPSAPHRTFVECIVSNRALPSADLAPESSPRVAPRASRLRAQALPSYAMDRLPIRFVAFVESRETAVHTIEARAQSDRGFLVVDSVIVHNGPLNERLSRMPLDQRRTMYNGPYLSQRHLAEVVCCDVRPHVNSLRRYRQHERRYFDPFVNPGCDAGARFDHHPVHLCPSGVTEAIVDVLAEAGVNDALALFVHRLALAVQKSEEGLWRRRVSQFLERRSSP